MLPPQTPEPPADSSQGPVELPIDGVLDLHAFRPQDVGDLVAEYLEECRRRGILEVRIIHGKGIGVLRATVHALLGRHPAVRSFHLAGAPFGGWGATIARLHPPESPSRAQSGPP